MKFQRIAISADQMGGLPCIRGLRIPVSVIVDLVAAKTPDEEILRLYPDLEPEDIREALAFASEISTTDAPLSCPTLGKLSEKERERLFDAFEQAIELAEKAGFSEAEIFQFFEDVIDVRASEQVLDKMDKTGEKPMTLEEFKKELDMQSE